MKKRIVKYFLVSAALISFITTDAVAVGNGFYMGLMLGPARNSASTQEIQIRNPHATQIQTVFARPNNSQFGTGLYLGYQFLPYGAFEFGATAYSAVRYDTRGVEPCSDTSVYAGDVHFLGKGILPLGEYVDFFAKAGVADTFVRTPGAFNPDVGTRPNGTLITCGKSRHKTKFAPTYGLGASYAITPNWVTDFTWMRTQVGGVVNNINLYALGISYHFVDRFCGQFLCDE